MSESESSDIQAAGQHYLVCGSEDCKRNGQFYCNVCHQEMCDQCRDRHLKNPDTKAHEVVLYRQRKRQLPVKKCKLHQTRNLDIFCKNCEIPVCSKCCTMQEHQGNHYDDLEEIYAEKFLICQNEVSKIQKHFLPTSQELKMDVKEDAAKIKNTMESIRASMKTEAESLKNMVDEVISENLEETNKIEKSLLRMLKSQEATYDEYIAHLEKHVEIICRDLAKTTLDICFSTFLEKLKIQNIPETIKPSLPVFTTSQYSKKDVASLLGKVKVPDTEPAKRNIKPIETKLNPTGKASRQEEERFRMKQTLSLSSSFTKVREYTVPGVDNAYHVSVDKSGRFWVSDNQGNLVQTDLQGNLLQKIQTSGRDEGYHTVTQDGGLIYTDKRKKMIYGITPDKKITEFIKTGDWDPLSIHSSRINGDILVGMREEGNWLDRKAKVSRYSKAGKEIQNIQRDNKGQKLYDWPHYTTENINGDICTSDYNKQAVVVVNKSGQYRFSYTGQGSVLYPFGICTDVLGHILVCDFFSESVHLLNQDGEFLSDILSQQGVEYPYGVCVDDENNVYVGQWNTNTVTVYKYLQ